jgi:translation initiation factor IF-1
MHQLKGEIIIDKIKVQGRVIEILPSEKFKVLLSNGTEVIGYLSGKMKKNHIRILLEDKVDLELSVYDLSKGRIVYRYV